eukprot:5613230-Pyramimonas_sp.AAC.3
MGNREGGKSRSRGGGFDARRYSSPERSPRQTIGAGANSVELPSVVSGTNNQSSNRTHLPVLVLDDGKTPPKGYQGDRFHGNVTSIKNPILTQYERVNQVDRSPGHEKGTEPPQHRPMRAFRTSYLGTGPPGGSESPIPTSRLARMSGPVFAQSLPNLSLKWVRDIEVATLLRSSP